MKLNQSDFIIKVNEVIQILGNDNIMQTKLDIRENLNELNIKFKVKGLMYDIRYICEEDEDEEDGYYFKCYISNKEGIIKKYISINDLIQGLKSKNYTIKSITNLCVTKIGVELANKLKVNYLNFKILNTKEIMYYMQDKDIVFNTVLTVNDIIKDYKHIIN